MAVNNVVLIEQFIYPSVKPSIKNVNAMLKISKIKLKV